MVMEGFLDDEDEGPCLPAYKYTLNKSIQPYVCSTPEDFNEEREYLLQKIFPQINEICLQRGGHFAPVDIRWSPLDDQVSTGQLLKLNLNLISKCSPFFLCLLGESYGPFRPVDNPKLSGETSSSEPATWIDRNFLVAYKAGYKWVLNESHQNSSLTELEVTQAAFLGECKHCFFYFRQPEHLEQKFGHLSEESQQKLSKTYLPRNEYADLNVRNLKQRIVKNGLPVKYFKSLEELGNHVLRDWTAILDVVYPSPIHEASFFDTEDYKQWVANEIFAESRRQVFVTSPEMRSLMEEMTEFATSAQDEPPFEAEEKLDRYKSYSVVSLLKKKKKLVEPTYKSLMLIDGERGCGKSTLMASWIPKFMIEQQDIKVITNYVGSSSWSLDLAVFLRHCIKELREEYLKPDSAVDVPRMTNEDQPWSFQEVCQAFVSALSLGPCVIIIDGFNELENTLGVTNRQFYDVKYDILMAKLQKVMRNKRRINTETLMVKDFKWLPSTLPPQCRLIITTCHTDLSYRAISSRCDTLVRSMPLLNTVKIRTHFLEDHMQQHFDHLDRENLGLINDMKYSHKALYLNILCNEMQTYNVFTNLTDFIDIVYDKCQSFRDLCVACFQRWTKDYSWKKASIYGEAPDSEPELELEGWVPDVLRLLAVSKTGLTQEDIFHMLGTLGYTGNQTVKNFDWLQFRICLGNMVYEGAEGHIKYSHQHLQDIVEYVLLRSAQKVDNQQKPLFTLSSLKSGGADISRSNQDKNWKGLKSKFHGYLARYFHHQPFSQRKLTELPHHLMMAGEFHKLVKVLTDTVMIAGFLDEKNGYPSNKFALAHYWEVLKEQGIDVVSSYTHYLTNQGILESKDKCEVASVSEVMEETMSSLSTTGGEEDDISAKPVVTLIVPRIITSSPKDRTLSVIEEAPSVADSYAPFSRQPSEDGDGEMERKGSISKMSVMSEYSDVQEELDTIFLTDHRSSKDNHAIETSPGKELPAFSSQIAQVAFLLAGFLQDIGHSEVTEEIMMALNNKFEKNYPLSEDDQLLHAKIQESLGKFAQKHGDIYQTEKWFRRSLRTIMDMANMDDDPTRDIDVINLKGCLLNHHGYLRMKEGLLDSAEDLFKEGLEYVTESRNLTDRATVLYNLGLLRMQQQEFLLAETSLRKSLMIREQWFGKSHPMVADVLFAIAGIMGNPNNERGFDKVASENLYRRALGIREEFFSVSHLSVSDTLFELGKLLKDESRYAARNEAIQLLKRALDIRITHLGGDHIDTRAVRTYLSKLEVTLKMGKYEFGPAKPTDLRTPDRPYSTLSWREKDVCNFDRRAKSRASSMSGSTTSSRPTSSKMDLIGYPLSRQSSLSFLSASEKLMLESERPRLLQREKEARRLKMSSEKGSMLSMDDTVDSRRYVTVELKVNENGEQDEDGGRVETRVAEPQIDSFGDEIGQIDRAMLVKVGKQVTMDPDLGPARLYNRYGSAGSNRSYTSNQSGDKKIQRTNSAKSGSSHITSTSRMTLASSRSNRSPTSAHAITPSTTRTITMGPNCDITSLLGPPKSPRDITRGIHHRSAWYHVPGRYGTVDKRFPPKRSQRTQEAQAYERFLTNTGPKSHHTQKKKYPPSKFAKYQVNWKDNGYANNENDANNFGPTVKGIGPFNGYHGEDDYYLNDGIPELQTNHGTSVKFKEAVIVD